MTYLFLLACVNTGSAWAGDWRAGYDDLYGLFGITYEQYLDRIFRDDEIVLRGPLVPNLKEGGIAGFYLGTHPVGGVGLVFVSRNGEHLCGNGCGHSHAEHTYRKTFATAVVVDGDVYPVTGTCSKDGTKIYVGATYDGGTIANHTFAETMVLATVPPDGGCRDIEFISIAGGGFFRNCADQYMARKGR